jgi:hypothetical protein
MSYEETEQLAIDAGALEPQGWGERAAAGIIVSNYGLWSTSPRAQARLRAWTEAILNGVHPSELKSKVVASPHYAAL